MSRGVRCKNNIEKKVWSCIVRFPDNHGRRGTWLGLAPPIDPFKDLFFHACFTCCRIRLAITCIYHANDHTLCRYPCCAKCNYRRSFFGKNTPVQCATRYYNVSLTHCLCILLHLVMDKWRLFWLFQSVAQKPSKSAYLASDFAQTKASSCLCLAVCLVLGLV